MAFQMNSFALLCLVSSMWALTFNAVESELSPCSSRIVLNMWDCMPYLRTGSTEKEPNGTCCSGLKTMLGKQAECVCETIKSNNTQFGIPLNVTRAMELFAACQVYASYCGFPAAAPGADGSGESSTFASVGESSRVSSTSDGSRISTGAVVGIVIGVVIVILVVLIGLFIIYRMKKKSTSSTPPPSPSLGVKGFSKSIFSYEELVMATDGFSNTNFLGEGGFGYVHRGVLPDGKEVAVKQLKAGSAQGDREFQAEVEIISRVHHRHLVSLVGYCITQSHRMLVYEFVPNNTLEFHLHGKGQPPLDWRTRFRIALGSAKGLAYLHEDCQPKIIHRDIKAANILLDINFEAKVADFGLAKLTSDFDTHVSTRVIGTFGYLAPEYAASGKLSEKSDVYSCGVMLLQLITGLQPFNSSQQFGDESFVDWARPLLTQALEDEKFDTLVDPRMGKDYSHNEMARIVACVVASVHQSAKRRPRMSQVVRALTGDMPLCELNEWTRLGSSDYDSPQCKEDIMMKFRKVAFASLESSSTDKSSNPTSEYGLHPYESSSEAQQSSWEMEMSTTKKDTSS